MTWTYSGFIRIHFNRKEEAPLLASITNWNHSWEVLATVLRVHGADLVSKSDLENARPGLDPVWWLEGMANVTLDDNGVAAVTKYEKPAGLVSGLAIDMLRESASVAQGQSSGFVPYGKFQHSDGPVYSTYGFKLATPVAKKRKTRKKAAKRRVHKTR